MLRTASKLKHPACRLHKRNGKAVLGFNYIGIRCWKRCSCLFSIGPDGLLYVFCLHSFFNSDCGCGVQYVSFIGHVLYKKIGKMPFNVLHLLTWGPPIHHDWLRCKYLNQTLHSSPTHPQDTVYSVLPEACLRSSYSVQVSARRFGSAPRPASQTLFPFLQTLLPSHRAPLQSLTYVLALQATFTFWLPVHRCLIFPDIHTCSGTGEE